MSPGARRPRLRPGVRLAGDPITGRPVLLAPDRGLVLSGSAAEIVRLGARGLTVDEIVRVLAERHGAGEAIVREGVASFLGALERRALLAWEAP